MLSLAGSSAELLKAIPEVTAGSIWFCRFIARHFLLKFLEMRVETSLAKQSD